MDFVIITYLPKYSYANHILLSILICENCLYASIFYGIHTIYRLIILTSVISFVSQMIPAL
jgi:hypothetical protein